MQSVVTDALRRQAKRRALGSFSSLRRAKVLFCSTQQHYHLASTAPLSSLSLLTRQKNQGSQSHGYHTSSKGKQYRTSSVHSAPAAAPLAMFETGDDDDEEEEEEDPQGLERLARLQMSSHLSPLGATRSRNQNLSSLDLELGEDTVWDDFDDYLEDEPGNDLDEDAAKAPPSKTTDKEKESSSALSRTNQKKTIEQMIRSFDPQNPPTSDDLEELQAWIECNAHQEGLLKYQKVLDDARERRDYASMTVFQRQVLRWFPNVRDAIAKMQSDFVLKKGDKPQTSMTRFGPFLCTQSPEKLAVITAHEALLLSLTGSGRFGRDGVSFTSMAIRIGEAVEQEVLIHRMLHKRALEQREWHKKREKDKEAKELGNDTNSTEKSEKETAETTITDDVKSLFKGTAFDDEALTVDGAPLNWAYATSHLKTYLEEVSKNDVSIKKKRVVRYAIKRARQVLEKHEWDVADRVGLGAALLHCLLENAKVPVNGLDEPAFAYESRWNGKESKIDKYAKVIILHERLHGMVTQDQVSGFAALTSRSKPMIVPPKPWKSSEGGGYLWLKSDLMRFHGSRIQRDAVATADMSTVYHGLNVLGRVPWKINKEILQVAWECWNQNIPLGEIPSRVDLELPEEPIPPTFSKTRLDPESREFKDRIDEWKTYYEALTKFRRTRQKNMDLRSLRCSAMLKLDQAEMYKDFEEVYFPYNMDFRGRAYPIPPHLSNVGSDLCRGMLKFSKAKPLGSRGLFWLKVHLANFAGMDKMTFEDRAAFVDENMDKVRQSAADPFAGERWWMGLDDPFQGLATCLEIVNAIDSGDPESYMCALPVHMDGSCNGLQHYAALGRDRIGGRAVNLCADKEPQDVYIGVMHEVVRRVAEEAKRTLDYDTTDVKNLDPKTRKEAEHHQAAKLVDGLIDRGVVKRTVMTSVYGVTYIGARNQIEEKIVAKLEGKGYEVDEMESEVFKACGYLATITMQAVGDLFVGAKQTMDWLTVSARMISQHGYPVAWISPIGIPAVQPYRQKKSSTIVTLMQTVTLVDGQDDLPIHRSRQVSAFPPNYVHSLDSSHMLLTALEMDKRGLDFSAVHDSFWTHACDIDEMNSALREVFVDLYSRPLLEELKASWEMRYPDLEFPPLPDRGELDLEEVKQAPYFFQ